MENLLTLPAPLTARLADLDLLVFPLDSVLVQDFFQQKMDFILEKCPGTVGIAADIAVHGPTGKEHTCKCQFAQPDASRAGARTSLQSRQMCY